MKLFFLIIVKEEFSLKYIVEIVVNVELAKELTFFLRRFKSYFNYQLKRIIDFTRVFDSRSISYFILLTCIF